MIYGLLIKTKLEFSKPLTLFNWLIRRRLPYDHAAVRFMEDGVWKVAEMKVFSGFTTTDYDKWLRQYDREIIEEELPCTVEEILKHKGKKYDISSTCWALPIYILTGHWIGRRHKAAERLFCFEKYAILKKETEFWLYMPGFVKK